MPCTCFCHNVSVTGATPGMTYTIKYPSCATGLDVFLTVDPAVNSSVNVCMLGGGAPIFVSAAGGSFSTYNTVGIQYGFKVVNCLDSNDYFYSASNFLSTYSGASQSISLVEFPRKCWYVLSFDICNTNILVTLDDTYIDCAECVSAIPPCYRLTDCSDSTNTMIISDDLSAYLGQVVTIFTSPAVVITTCWIVTISNTCVGSVSATVLTAFSSCLLCNPPVPGCGCPPGSILDADGYCVTTVNTAPIVNTTVYTACKGDVKTGVMPTAFPPGYSASTWPLQVYGLTGASFYEDISAKPFPIVALPVPIPCSLAPVYPAFCPVWNFYQVTPLQDATLNSILVTNVVQNDVWGKTTGCDLINSPNFRLNKVGIWTCEPPINFTSQPVNEWIGFTFCETILTTKTYYIGIAGDDSYQLYLNGTLIVDHSGTGFGFTSWKIIPITLQAGPVIFEARIINFTSVATLGFEIYDATLAELLAVTTANNTPGATDLNQYIIFSTLDKIGQTWETGETSGYTCPDGYVLNTCDGFVCSQVIVVPPLPCLYEITPCGSTGLTPIISNLDLSAYTSGVWTITLTGDPSWPNGIYCVTVVAIFVGTPVVFNGIFGTSFIDCDACDPTCYLLTNCINPLLTITTSTDLSLLLGSIVSVNGSCWTVSIAPDCVGSLPIIVDQVYSSCYECLPKCYILRDCNDPALVVQVSNDLSPYIGQVVHIKGCGTTCWIVEQSINCTQCFQVEVTESFIDCDSCAPIIPDLPPIELHPRKVKPGYDTPGCPPEYTEKVNCNYGEFLYNEVMAKRYGISVCCQEDKLKWEIKKNLLDLKSIYDPELCKSTLNKCCPPSCVESTLSIFRGVTCPAPSMVTSVLIYPVSCVAPDRVSTMINLPLIAPCPRCLP